MRKTVAAVLCCFLMSGSAFAAPKASVPSAPPALQEQLSYFDLTSKEPVRVIVRLSAEPAAIRGAADRAAQLQKIRTERGNVLSHLKRLSIESTPHLTYEQALNGFAIVLPANQLADLASIAGVTAIVPDAEVVRDETGDVVPAPAPELTTSVPAIRAPEAWSLGYRGEGMLVAIIDDGVDYTHPDLGGCLGAGCKVVAGYDFVDVDADPQEGLTSGARDYHGTHVAATAAGLKGVAPAAKVLAVRVLGTSGSGKTNNLSTVMAGIDYAVAMGAHVANMSLGLQNTYAQTGNLWGEQVSNAIRAGVVFANSNGNNGPTTYTTGVYAASADTIGVANSDARPIPYPRTVVNATGEVLTGGSYGAIYPSSVLGVSMAVVNVGYGNAATDYAGKDVTGKIAIAQRGGPGDANFTNKADQARIAGAAAIIIYNDLARSVDFSTAALSLPSFTMSYPNGQKVLANPSITVSNFDPGVQINAGSSRGPTPDLQIKPDVSAPGTDIVAAVPFAVSATGYAALNGTSMASPHVAGAAALLRQARPDWTPAQIKLALMNTARNLRNTAGDSYRPIEQGAGLVDIERALRPQLTIAPGSIGFGQLLQQNGYTKTRTLTLRGVSGTYAVSASTMKTWSGVTVGVSNASVTLVDGTATVQVTATVNPAAVSGEYEGYVNFVNAADATDTYRVPFLFVHDVPVSEVQLSDVFVGTLANNRESIDVSFNFGRPVTNWYLGTLAGTRFTVNQGSSAAGSKTIRWNGRTSIGQLLGEGNWNMAVWYQPVGSSTFVVSSNAYARFFVDRTAPVIGLDATPQALTNSSTITVRGAVGDVGMYTWGEVGGAVRVNGANADLFHRAPAQLFTLQNSELAFTATVTLAEGENSFTVYSQDAAGNRSSTTFNLDVTSDTIAPVTYATATPAANAFGWNNTTVGLAFASTDGGSGVKEVRYSIGGAADVVTAGASAALSLTADGIHGISYHAVDNAGNAEIARSTTIRIDSVKPVITFIGATAYTVDQRVIVRCSAADALSGIDGTPCADPLIDAFAYELALGTTAVSTSAADKAGNTSTGHASVIVSVTFDALKNLTRSFIADAGLQTAALAHLDAAKSSSARGNTAAANNSLTSYQNFIAAQSGKSVTNGATLISLAGALKR